MLLPLDVLKIKRQTNPEAFRGRGIFKIIADEGFGLYRGWGWTAARNAPGSFAVSASTLVVLVDANYTLSYSVAQPLQNSSSTISKTTTKPAGSKTSWPLSPVPRPR